MWRTEGGAETVSAAARTGQRVRVRQECQEPGCVLVREQQQEPVAYWCVSNTGKRWPIGVSATPATGGVSVRQQHQEPVAYRCVSNTGNRVAYTSDSYGP